MEGCTAPKFETATLHSAVVELVALKDAKIQYITVQNWSNNVFNLVTKRAHAEENAEVKWIDCNIGSRLTTEISVVLRDAKPAVKSYPLPSPTMDSIKIQQMIHLADETSSNIISKSISIGEGRSTYRGQVHAQTLKKCINNTECDALLINTNIELTLPGDYHPRRFQYRSHEASVSKVSAEQFFPRNADSPKAKR